MVDSTTSATYDRIAAKFLARSCDRSLMQEQLDVFSARLPVGGLVLDVGCGPGFDTAELRRRGHRVVGVDLSQGMLRIGQEQYPGDYVQANMLKLPFDGGIDGIWACASMLHLGRSDFPRGVEGFARVLKPGGCISLSLKKGEGEEWDTRYGAENKRWFTFWQENDVDGHLRAHGFHMVDSAADLNRYRGWIRRLAIFGPGQ